MSSKDARWTALHPGRNFAIGRRESVIEINAAPGVGVIISAIAWPMKTTLSSVTIAQ
jgi:hypothetical protein